MLQRRTAGRSRSCTAGGGRGILIGRLPLTGQVDQLIKLLEADDVQALLYGPEASYLGRKVTPLTVAEGGPGAS